MAMLLCSSSASGALGAGLAILSRYPLLESTTIPYHLTGRPLGFSDFYVNKAAGSIMIEHPTIGEMDIYTTHVSLARARSSLACCCCCCCARGTDVAPRPVRPQMHAGGPEGYELGNSYRSSQAWQLSKYITRSARQGRYVLACGDFNFQSNELPYRVMRDAGRVQDAWIEFAQRRADERNQPDDGGRDAFVERWDMVGKPFSSAERAIDEAGVTVDCESWSCFSLRAGRVSADLAAFSSSAPINSWTWGKNIPPVVQRTQGKRLDYVFHRPPSCPPRWTDYLCSGPTSTFSTSPLPAPPSVELRCVDAEVVVRGLVPGKAYSYSDHFGVRARFEIVPSRGLLPTPSDGPKGAVPRGSRQSSGAPSDASDDSASSSTPLAVEERRASPSGATAQTYEELGRVLRHHQKVHVRHARQLFALVPPCVLLHSPCLSRASDLSSFPRSAIVLLIALTVASAFLPLRSYLAPIFVLFGGLVGIGGVTALITGFVWGRWEDGGLRRVLEELEEERRRVGLK